MSVIGECSISYAFKYFDLFNSDPVKIGVFYQFNRSDFWCIYYAYLDFQASVDTFLFTIDCKGK